MGYFCSSGCYKIDFLGAKGSDGQSAASQAAVKPTMTVPRGTGKMSVAPDLTKLSKSRNSELSISSDLGFSVSRYRSTPFFVRQETRAMCVRLRHACAAIED